MTTIVVCDDCGRGEEYSDEHRAKADGWEGLQIDGVIGPANASEWHGVCPTCAR